MSTPLSQTPFQQLLIHPRCFNSIKPNGRLLFHVGLLFHNSQSRFFRTTYQVVYMPFKNTYALQKKSNNYSFDYKNFWVPLQVTRNIPIIGPRKSKNSSSQIKRNASKRTSILANAVLNSNHELFPLIWEFSTLSQF